MKRPFPAYKGDDAYVFVSYSHGDSRVVFPELTWIRSNDVNVWYDEGIDPGTDWRDEIGEALLGCRLCLFFVSTRSVESTHCVREVLFALDNDIPVVPVYLEPTPLPPGLGMSLSNLQAINKYDLAQVEYETRVFTAIRTQMVSADGATVRHRRSLSWRSTLVAALVVVALGVGWLVSVDVLRQAPLATTVEDVAVAVLPFRGTSDPGGEAFSEGMRKAVHDVLVSTNRLPVVALRSAKAIESSLLTEIEIAELLGATHLIDGERESGDAIRVRLIAGDTGEEVWAGRFSGDRLESVARRRDIAEQAVGEILPALGVRLDVPLTRNPAEAPNETAYKLYLEATNLDINLPEENRRASQLLEQATRLAPSFADGWAELAFAQWQTTATPLAKKERVKASLQKALLADPGHGSALALLGTITARCDYGWAAGWRMLERARLEHPFDARVQALWAHHLGSIHHPDAPEASLLAYRLDPLSGPAVEDYARSLFTLGRQLDALAVRRNYLESRMDDGPNVVVVQTLIALREFEEAAAGLEELKGVLGSSHPEVLAMRLQIAFGQRDFETAGRLEGELMARLPNEAMRFEVGSPESSLERIRIAVEQRHPQVIFALLGGKPSSIPQDVWEGLRAQVRVEDLNTPVVGNYRARTAEEKAELLERKIPLEFARAQELAGEYTSPRFPALEFEVHQDHLALALPFLSGSDRFVIQTEPGVFELLAMRGFIYRFGEAGALVAVNGQIERDYRRQ